MIDMIIEAYHLLEAGYDMFERPLVESTYYAETTAPARLGDWEI